MNHIVSEIKPIEACSAYEVQTCYQLLCQGFLGVNWQEFMRDFQEKEAVILLHRDHCDGEIIGFSTLMVLTLVFADEEVKSVFSGDTYVLPEYRSSTSLGVQLGTYFLRACERFPQQAVYYILMSKGWRTYKILPFLFRDFYPQHALSTPAYERAIMDAFG